MSAEALPLTNDTVFEAEVSACKHCGYEPDEDDYPLIDGDECEECHFLHLQAEERWND